jgi:hypothetical protein
VIKPYEKIYRGHNVENFRGSKYRGISRNGKSWQILIMRNKRKMYLGAMADEEEAAELYDRVAI